MRISAIPIMLAASLGLAAAVPARAQAPAASGAVGAETFRAGTTGALGRLCGASPADSVGTAANVYCHGFLSGVGQFHREISREGGVLAPLFCLPQPPPAVSQVANAFAAWVRSNPGYEAEPAVDGVVRFAQATYPCPVQPAAARRSRSR